MFPSDDGRCIDTATLTSPGRVTRSRRACAARTRCDTDGVRKLLIVLVVLVVVLVAADFGLRAYSEYRAAQSIDQEANGQIDADVSIEGFPFLWQAARGEYPQVVVTATTTRQGAVAGAHAEADLHDVTLPLSDALGGNVDTLTAQSSTLKAYLPLSSLPAAIGGDAANNVTFSPGANGGVQVSTTVTVLGQRIPMSGTASISIRNDTLRIAVSDLQAAGVSLSAGSSQAAGASADQLEQALTTTVPLNWLPFSVTSGDVAVVGSDLVLSVGTGPFTLSQLRWNGR